ncbi:MAG: hypothetical protein K0R48_672 [Gammaproteobacteria bacterium]|jgi:hypothetical protein|nr:hypothetical protein [Gammaproteobacteria bacterium]
MRPEEINAQAYKFENIQKKMDGHKSTIIKVYKNSVLNWL